MRKISELTTDNAMDIICEIIPYVEEIITDEELMNEVKSKLNLSEGANKLEFYYALIGKVSKIAPILLKKKRGAIYGILAAFNEVPVANISKQNFIITLRQITELVKDKQVVELFTSYGNAEQTE
jgi:hypothetical protein